MPIYVYECKKCEQTFEVEQRIVEDALTDCILCPDGKVKRIIQPTAVIFNGSGFYVNDSNKGSSKAVNPAAEPAPAPKPAETPAPAVTKPTTTA